MYVGLMKLQTLHTALPLVPLWGWNYY